MACIGGVAESVLRAKLFGDLVVDLGDGLLAADLEETSAGLLGHALQDLFAVDVALAAASTGIIATPTTAAGVATSAGISPPPG